VASKVETCELLNILTTYQQRKCFQSTLTTKHTLNMFSLSKRKTNELLDIHNDAPPSSLMDSTVSPKVNTMEGERVGARSLTHNILGVEGHARVSRWD